MLHFFPHALSAVLPSQPVEASVTQTVCFQPSVLDFDRYCWCCTTAILSLSSCLLVRVSPLCVALCSVMWTLFPKCEANCSEPVTHGLTPLKSS